MGNLSSSSTPHIIKRGINPSTRRTSHQPLQSTPHFAHHVPPLSPTRQAICQLKGGVCQVKGGCLCCCRLRNFPCRKRHSIIRCWCFDQCYRYSLLQGSRLFGIFDLLRQLCPIFH